MTDIPYTMLDIRSRTSRTTRKYKLKDFVAFDTETYKGACKLLASSKKKYIYNPSFYDCLEFLTDSAYYDSNLVFYNIDFDIGAILKLFKVKDLWNYIASGLKVSLDEYTIQYFRPSFLIIHKEKERYTFTDAFRFFQTSLDNASNQYLHKEKMKQIDASRLNDSLGYWKKHKTTIINYCIKDCMLTAELMEYLQKYIHERFDLIPRYYVSCASLSKTYFRSNCYIPSLKNIPKKAIRGAYLSYRGGRFEILKRGYFPFLIEYDINSAYPHAISEILSAKKGKWMRVKYFEPNAYYGFYKVMIEENDTILGRIPYKQDGSILVFPRGIFEMWITQQELALFSPEEYKIAIGYIYLPSERDYYPFKDAVNTLYNDRKTIPKEEMMNYILKITLNSLYGTFIERNKIYSWLYRTGALFNPIYASFITAKVRVKLYELANKFKEQTVALHTDSIMFDSKVDVKESNKLGDWKKEDSGKGIVVNTGVYTIGDIHKQRGFSRKQLNVFDLLKENQHLTKIPYPEQHFVKLREAITRKDYIDKLNTIIPLIKDLDINADTKRLWKKEWKNAGELLRSNMISYTRLLRSRFRRFRRLF